ncbi:MAG: hypothetical protein HQL45_07815, partial [Alphaproteobacteria bacterium]|nr:hypothetical protein [Alphaproteobacteria bacterium]
MAMTRDVNSAANSRPPLAKGKGQGRAASHPAAEDSLPADGVWGDLLQASPWSNRPFRGLRNAPMLPFAEAEMTKSPPIGTEIWDPGWSGDDSGKDTDQASAEVEIRVDIDAAPATVIDIEVDIEVEAASSQPEREAVPEPVVVAVEPKVVAEEPEPEPVPEPVVVVVEPEVVAEEIEPEPEPVVVVVEPEVVAEEIE